MNTNQNEEEILKQQIAELEAKLKPLKERQVEIRLEKAKNVEERIKQAQRGNGDFNPEELVFAAYSRCPCGAGMAYPTNVSFHGSWECSAILMGEADRRVIHESPLPFAFYEIKSENQPSADGATTRKKAEPKSDLQKAVEKARGGPTPPIQQLGYA